jgi:DNA-binding XRE family transcriptional regulator
MTGFPIRVIAKPEFADARIKAGMNIQDLATKVCRGRSHIYLLEKGRRGTTAAQAKMITDALGVTFDDIFRIEKRDGSV